jgi:hypothetical protein
VATELIQPSYGHSNSLSADRDTLYLLGGVAMIVFGAGLVLSNPTVRRFLGQMGIGNLAKAALPDMERYLRLRSM